MSTEHPTTYDEADRISPHEHMSWYGDVDARLTERHLSTPVAEVHLERLARAAVLVRVLAAGQPADVHRAILAGASLSDIADAVGEPQAIVVECWQAWSSGQRDLWRAWTDKGLGAEEVLNVDVAEHDQVAATLAEQLADA